MQVSDALAYERILLASPGGANTRWSDAQLITLTDLAVKAMVARVLFPESRIMFTTVAGQQEYTLPEMHGIYRVYVNGQRISETPGNIDTLEGSQIDFDDSTGSGSVAVGSGAPGSAGGQMQPQWVVQTPVTYPFLNAWGAPTPRAQPWFPGQSPRYYLRGGTLGIVPAPISAGATITVEGVRVPDTLYTADQSIIVPSNFLEGIANYVLYRACSADKDELSIQMSRAALADFDREVRVQRTWKRQFSKDDEQLLPLTYRGAFKYGMNRA